MTTAILSFDNNFESARDLTAFYEDIVDTYSKDLFRYAYWLCHDKHVAEDLVQETFLRAWKSIHKLRDLKAAKSWLITILRRENARRFERVQPIIANVEPEQIQARHEEYDTSTEAFVLRRAVEELPEEYREPLLLQVIHGYSCHEISKQLGISEGATTTRVFRARQKLRDALGERLTQV